MPYPDTVCHTLNCKGSLLSLENPVVMGILNLTDNSFYDGGRYLTVEKALERALEMAEQGAAIIDLGAASSKPGSLISDPDKEIELLLPVIGAILKERPETVLSVDTYHSTVADAALQAGAAIINDISGGNIDPDILDVCARYQAPFILMHMQGLPENMQDHPQYQDLLTDVTDYFIRQVYKATEAGIKDIVIDPGFGFGKTIAQNFKLLRNLNSFCYMLNRPLLAGLSRKSMIWKTLNNTPEQALNGTSALNMVALQNGAKILRVHDVREATEVIRLYKALYQS